MKLHISVKNSETTVHDFAGELGSRSAFIRITLSLSFGPLNR
jgi:hypothetical protein